MPDNGFGANRAYAHLLAEKYLPTAPAKYISRGRLQRSLRMN